MILQVQLFAQLRDDFGTSSLEVTLPHGATVMNLRMQLAQLTARPDLLNKCRIAINQDFASDGDVIPENAEVAVIPPVSGG